jgi:hypothetical protein
MERILENYYGNYGDGIKLGENTVMVEQSCGGFTSVSSDDSDEAWASVHAYSNSSFTFDPVIDCKMFVQKS